MKSFVLVMIGMASSVVWAQDEDAARAVAIDEVNDRISVIEVINVTAEKPPALTTDESDPDIDAILDEAEALEAAEDSE